MDEIARIIKARNQALFVKQQSIFTDRELNVPDGVQKEGDIRIRKGRRYQQIEGEWVLIKGERRLPPPSGQPRQ